MQFFYDFIPILIFFAAYKFFNIYIATTTAMITSGLQVLFHWYKHRTFEKMQLITFIVILLLGGATLWLHNPMFIKWKPSVIYWCFAIIFLGSQYIGQHPFIYHVMGKQLELPRRAWETLNLSWVIFFVCLGIANIYIAYHFSTNTWVDFKLFGTLGGTLLFVTGQAIFLAKHVKDA
ncbi:MAG: septation protein A [Pseudomonadota bacterium]|nr:septation protein A [Gammaproteobacteria bacterium]MBU1629147.1 septation protein A [Gammaproteobacteria bacterium]MBU1927165.1 septation protein A [Gammaproteobacteria bacterium]MBU2546223.1 septation protein A [Gammaproteobacteria bacterium]